MVYCTKCGTQFEGRFCPQCGAPADSTETPPRDAPGQGVPPPYQACGQGRAPSNWASVICYVVLIAGPLVFLFLAPYNRDRRIRFDAWQALFVQIAYIGIHLVLSAFGDISWRTTLLLTRVVDLAYLILILFMAVKSYQNERILLPIVGPLAEKQK